MSQIFIVLKSRSAEDDSFRGIYTLGRQLGIMQYSGSVPAILESGSDGMDEFVLEQAVWPGTQVHQEDAAALRPG